MGSAGRGRNQVHIRLAGESALLGEGDDPLRALALGKRLVPGIGVLFALEDQHGVTGRFTGEHFEVAPETLGVLPDRLLAGLLHGQGHLHARQQDGLAAQQPLQVRHGDLGAVEYFGFGDTTTRAPLRRSPLTGWARLQAAARRRRWRRRAYGPVALVVRSPDRHFEP